jgi:hypothetical protein
MICNRCGEEISSEETYWMREDPWARHHDKCYHEVLNAVWTKVEPKILKEPNQCCGHPRMMQPVKKCPGES